MELTSRTSGMCSGSNHLLRKWWASWPHGRLSGLHDCHSGEGYRDRYLINSVPSSSCFWDAMNMYVTLSSIPDPTLPHFCSLGSGQRWVGLGVWRLYQFDWCVCPSLYFSGCQLDLLAVLSKRQPCDGPHTSCFRATCWPLEGSNYFLPLLSCSAFLMRTVIRGLWRPEEWAREKNNWASNAGHHK